jgi:hypothetical protein
VRRRRISDYAPVTGWEVAGALAALVLFSFAMSLLLGPDQAEGAEPEVQEIVQRVRVTLTGFSAHSGPHEFESIHPGLGLEYQISPDAESPWGFAFWGHYMVSDSNARPAWWAGPSVSYAIGDRDGLHLEPRLVLAWGQKHELHDGDPGLLGMPVLGLGYGPVGMDLGIVPATPLTNDVAVWFAMLWFRFTAGGGE